MTEKPNKEFNEEVVEETCECGKEDCAETKADVKKEVQRILDDAMEETEKAIAGAKKFYEENKDKVNVENAKKILNDASDAVGKTWDDSMKKLDEFKNDPEVQERVEKAKVTITSVYNTSVDKIKETYEAVKSNEDFQDVGNKIRDGAEKSFAAVKKTMDDVASNPKVQETVSDIKKGIVDVAEKTAETLKNWLEKDDEVVEGAKTTEESDSKE